MGVVVQKAVPILLLVGYLMAVGCSRRYGRYHQTSPSMEPSIKQGASVVLDTEAYATNGPKRWDVIAFRYPKDTNLVFISRVVGLPGEVIRVATSGVVVNGNIVAPPHWMERIRHASHEAARYGVNDGFRVPNNGVFVLGDNPMANDSRFWGPVPQGSVMGEVLLPNSD